MKNKFDLITVIFVALSMLIVPVCLIVMPKKEFSENENRNLAVFPSVSINGIKSGQFMDEFNEYVTDHFPLRDSWISVKTETDILLGKAKINDVWIARDGYLIGDYVAPEKTEKTGEIFKRFLAGVHEENPDIVVKMMLVPTSITINQELLPIVASLSVNQLDEINKITEISGIDNIEVYDALMEHRNEQLFYRTDHHWTTLGAYYAYVEYCKSAGFTPVRLEDMESKVVTDEFLGTFASKVNRPLQIKDTITIYTNPADKLTVNYVVRGEITDTLYDMKYIDMKDKYSMFLSNLNPLIEITNETAETDRELILVKDSYANSMVPFLVRHYRKIYVFDTRSYMDGPSYFIEDHKDVTDVLILYNMHTIDTDSGIRGIY